MSVKPDTARIASVLTLVAGSASASTSIFGLSGWNSDPKPFIWKATADDIIKKVSRGRETLHQIQSATDH